MKTLAEKINEERDIDEFEYESSLNWKYMKTLRSETKVRSWHVKVATGETNEKGKPIFDNYCVSQVFFSTKIGIC